MATAKTALPKQVRVVKYFETRDKDGAKVTYSPSSKPVQITDKELLAEVLEAGLVVAFESEEDEETED